jgi:chlorophyllide a reductase subunit X
MFGNGKQPGSKTARMLAVYGKGGMGKSFFTTNLVSKLALLNHRVLQLGCDPKHDSCNALFGGTSLPTLGDTWRAFKEQDRHHELRVHDVIFKTQIMDGQATVFGCEIGGPEVGRGCGGRGISFGFDVLDQMGISQWALDYIVMDFLGDVVCGGFAMPLARSLAEEVIILCGNDRQSLYAANNIVRAAEYFTRMGGTTRLLGLVINRDDGSGIAERFAERIGLPVLLKIPLSSKARDLADSFKLAILDEEFDALFGQIAQAIITRSTPPVGTVTPLDYEEFMSVFGAVDTGISPERAYIEDLLGTTKSVAEPAPIPVTSIQETVRDDTLNGSNNAVAIRLLNELGMYVTDVSVDPKKGLTLTVDGNVTICFGSDQELDSKIAILAALRRSGEHYHYVDLRRPASPLYR